MSAFPELLSPLPIGAKSVRNRIVSTPHVPGYDEHGLLREQHIRYLERKAAGGAGMVMAFGSANVHPEAAVAFNTPNIWDAANEDALGDLARRIHAHGALILSQATHMGRRSSGFASGALVQAPSAVRELTHGELPHVLRTREIAAIVGSFADAARRLERCGFDGIEITSFGGHLIEQFLSPVANRRDDAYGGSFDHRVRFALEVVEAVGEAVSDDFLVGFRMSGDASVEEVGLDRDDLLAAAERLDALGRIDLFSISGSTGANRESQAGTVPPDHLPAGTYLELARGMRARLSVPVLAAGRILDVAQAEEALARGDCDLVAMVRATIADPDLPRLVQAGEAERIRPCIALNQDCIGRVAMGYPLRCAVNPEIGREAEFAALEARAPASPRRLVVVGGGPAGLEAARVAAGRGHSVVLFELADRLGGQVLAAARAPDRAHLGRHVAWLAAELERAGVDVRLGVEADADTVLAERPDAVVVATGAADAVPGDVPGVTDVAVFEGDVAVPAGGSVLVYDGEGQFRGPGAALAAAAAGAGRVELALPYLEVCEHADPWQKPLTLHRLFDAGVVCSTNEKLRLEGGPARIGHAWSGRERRLDEFDLVVFAGFPVARDALADDLLERLGETRVRAIGDCRAPRRIHDAVLEGALAGHAVGVELGVPELAAAR